MWISLPDGWRDESSEGPYTETLQTKYDWSNHKQWSIVRLHDQKLFKLTLDGKFVDSFNSIDEAKSFVNSYTK